MSDSLGMHDRFGEVEALVQAAGEYVYASDDLRPRVLETAKTVRDERRRQRWVRHATIAAAIVSMAVSVGSSTRGSRLEIVGVDAVYQQAALNASRSGELGWGLVQTFSDLREQQSEKLRFE